MAVSVSLVILTGSSDVLVIVIVYGTSPPGSSTVAFPSGWSCFVSSTVGGTRSNVMTAPALEQARVPVVVVNGHDDRVLVLQLGGELGDEHRERAGVRVVARAGDAVVRFELGAGDARRVRTRGEVTVDVVGERIDGDRLERVVLDGDGERDELTGLVDRRLVGRLRDDVSGGSRR